MKTTLAQLVEQNGLPLEVHKLGKSWDREMILAASVKKKGHFMTDAGYTLEGSSTEYKIASIEGRFEATADVAGNFSECLVFCPENLPPNITPELLKNKKFTVTIKEIESDLLKAEGEDEIPY